MDPPAGQGQGTGRTVCIRPHPSQPSPTFDNPRATLHKQAEGAKRPLLPLTPASRNTRESGAAARSQTFEYISFLLILHGKHFPLRKYSNAKGRPCIFLETLFHVFIYSLFMIHSFTQSI